MANVSVNEKQGVPESADIIEYERAIKAAANRNYKAVSAFDEAQTLTHHAQCVLECVSIAARSDEGINGYVTDGACEAIYSMLEKINANLNTLFSQWQKRAEQA